MSERRVDGKEQLRGTILVDARERADPVPTKPLEDTLRTDAPILGRGNQLAPSGLPLRQIYTVCNVCVWSGIC